MTISATNATSGPFVPNGATTAFPFTFAVGSASELRVRIDDVVVSSSLYTVALNSPNAAIHEGGMVTFAVAPTGSELLIESDPDFNQDIAFTNSGPFLAESHDEANDRQAIKAIFLKSELDRAVKLPVGSTAPDYDDFVETVRGPQGVPGSGNLIGFSADDYLTPNSAVSGVINANNIGLAALSAAINAVGGGVLDFTPGATYWVGGQTFGAARTSGQFTNYTGVPDLLLEFVNCAKAIIIRGNGAKLKLAAGLKYGAFDAAGVAVATTPPYFGATITSYYVNVIAATGCSGPFECKNLEIDGSSNTAVLGGQWGDTGWQLGGEGIKLSDHTGTVLIDGVNCHHHTSDGLEINGVAVSAAAYTEGVTIKRSKFNYNGRLGVAIVGGRGIDFEDCQFNWNANTSATGSSISSAPASGVDIEAEGGKVNRDIRFKRCEYVGNQNTQIVADSGPSSDITCDDSRFVSTVAGGTAVWPNKPRMRFNRCLVAGTVVTPYRDLLIPNDTVGWEDCLFSISNEHSPTGSVGTVNNLSFDVPTATGLLFVRCRFDFNKPVPATATNFSTDHPRYVDCCFTARDGYPAWNGRFVGKTEFIETGAGSIQYMPGGLVAPFLSKFNAGYAEDSFAYTTGGVRTIYPANFSRHENKPVYFGSAVYDPPSLAAGAKTGIQTIVGGTLAGVALGDRIDTVSFSLDLAGARVVAWVSAANTVSFYFINENGANPLDLGSGTVRVKVIAA